MPSKRAILAARHSRAAAEASAGGHLSVEQHWAPATDAAGGVRLWYTLRNNGSAPL